jgi:hypothetical protein
MQRPAPLAVRGEPTLELSYFLYNCSKKQPEYEERSAAPSCYPVPAVLQAAWHYRDESAAWLLLNLAPEERAIELTLDPPLLGGEYPVPCQLTVYQEGEPAKPLGPLARRRVVALRLPPRRPIMIEARR